MEEAKTRGCGRCRIPLLLQEMKVLSYINYFLVAVTTEKAAKTIAAISANTAKQGR